MRLLVNKIIRALDLIYFYKSEDAQLYYDYGPKLSLFTSQKLFRASLHGSMGCTQKGFKLVWRCHQLSGFLAKGHFPRVSGQSRLSADVWMIMRWYLGLCGDFLAFILQLRKTPEILSKETVDEGCANSHRLKWGLFPTKTSLGSYSTPGREMEGKKERTDGTDKG